MTIRVGIVGLSATGSWAVWGHLPALRAVEGFEITAVATSSEETAREAADKYGIAHAFSSVEELARCEDVDLIVIAVKVPEHRRLVLEALAVDKPVLCEWPLANGVDEARELAAAAAGRDNVFVGFQGTAAPWVRHLRTLIAEGFLGDVISTSILASSGPWGGPVGNSSAYLLDKTHGATLLSIVFGQIVDSFSFVLGDFAEVAATTAVRHPRVLNADSGEMVEATADDEIAVTGKLAGGAVASIHLRGANKHSAKMVWEIVGTDGYLRVEGSGGTLSTTLTVTGAHGDEELHPIELPAGYDAHPELAGSPAHAVAHEYDRIRAHLEGGSPDAPDFEHGLARHRLLDAIERASVTGQRQPIDAVVE